MVYKFTAATKIGAGDLGFNPRDTDFVKARGSVKIAHHLPRQLQLQGCFDSQIHKIQQLMTGTAVLSTRWRIFASSLHPTLQYHCVIVTSTTQYDAVFS